MEQLWITDWSYKSIQIFLNINSNQICEVRFFSNSISMRQRKRPADGQSGSPRLGGEGVFCDPRVFFLSPWLLPCSGAQCPPLTKAITSAGKNSYQQGNGRKLSRINSEELNEGANGKMWAGKGNWWGMGEHPVTVTSRVLFPPQCQGAGGGGTLMRIDRSFSRGARRGCPQGPASWSTEEALEGQTAHLQGQTGDSQHRVWHQIVRSLTSLDCF